MPDERRIDITGKKDPGKKYLRDHKVPVLGDKPPQKPAKKNSPTMIVILIAAIAVVALRFAIPAAIQYFSIPK